MESDTNSLLIRIAYLSYQGASFPHRLGGLLAICLLFLSLSCLHHSGEERSQPYTLVYLDPVDSQLHLFGDYNLAVFTSSTGSSVPVIWQNRDDTVGDFSQVERMEIGRSYKLTLSKSSVEPSFLIRSMRGEIAILFPVPGSSDTTSLTMFRDGRFVTLYESPDIVGWFIRKK